MLNASGAREDATGLVNYDMQRYGRQCCCIHSWYIHSPLKLPLFSRLSSLPILSFFSAFFFVSGSVHPSVRPSLCLSFCLSVRPIYLSVCPTVSLSLRPYGLTVTLIGNCHFVMSPFVFMLSSSLFLGSPKQVSLWRRKVRGLWPWHTAEESTDSQTGRVSAENGGVCLLPWQLPLCQ